jgi:DNA (cytosine-5)-methyltransferase 1
MHTLIPDVANPLTARMHKGINTTLDEGQTPIAAFTQNQRDEVRTMEVAGALAAEPGAKQQTYVAFTASDQSNKAAWESDVNPTLNAQVPNDTSNIQYGIRQDMAVRRLTPLECERLQGFPDNYTNIPKASDSGRYKALGNSMAVPVMHWIGKRISEVDKQ